MREDPMDPNEYLLREIWINRRACEIAIHEHRMRKARSDAGFQMFLLHMLEDARRFGDEQ